MNPTIIAIYAAVLSTASVIIHIANFLRDRTKVLIMVQWMARIQEFPVTESTPVSNWPTSGDRSLYTTFSGALITISNAGRRPLTLTNVALREYGKMSLSLTTEPVLPAQLTEGQSVQVELDYSLYDFDLYPYIEATDAVGRVYRRRISVGYWKALWRRLTHLRGTQGNTTKGKPLKPRLRSDED
jgi:hypothetical protein